MPKAVIFDNGKPVAASDKKEAERLTGKIAIIDKVLKEMGFPKGYENYNEYVQEMANKDFKKYIKFLDKVDKLSKEQGI